MGRQDVSESHFLERESWALSLSLCVLFQKHASALPAAGTATSSPRLAGGPSPKVAGSGQG